MRLKLLKQTTEFFFPSPIRVILAVCFSLMGELHIKEHSSWSAYHRDPDDWGAKKEMSRIRAEVLAELRQAEELEIQDIIKNRKQKRLSRNFDSHAGSVNGKGSVIESEVGGIKYTRIAEDEVQTQMMANTIEQKAASALRYSRGRISRSLAHRHTHTCLPRFNRHHRN